MLVSWFKLFEKESCGQLFLSSPTSANRIGSEVVEWDEIERMTANEIWQINKTEELTFSGNHGVTNGI
jgi:hypothetical protein